MSEHRNSDGEGTWIILCVLLLFLLAGAGAFVWLKQRDAARERAALRAIAAEQMQRAAEKNLIQAEAAMERAEDARIQALNSQASAPTRSASDSQAAAGVQPLIPELYVNQDLWQHVESLADAEPDARVYTLDRESGEVTFGDGKHGAAPPDAPVTAQATYQTAGGGTVTVYLPDTDLRNSRVRAVQTGEGLLRLEVIDPKRDD